MQDIYSQIERFTTYANHANGDQRLMELQSFKEILGIIGNFQIADRMFAAIDDNRDGLISLEDFLIYNDILAYGTEQEKDFITFKVFDVKGEGKVYYDNFRLFWSSFIELYVEALETGIQFDEELIKYAFTSIASDKEFFDFPTFQKAKSQKPELFEWLEQPGAFMKEFVSENHINAKIDIKVLEEYHSNAIEALDELERVID